MNNLIVLLSTLFALSFSNGSTKDKWEILVNKIPIQKGDTDNEGTVVKVKANSINENDKFDIKYTSAEEVAGWNRTFYLNHENDQTIRTVELDKSSGSIIINPADIKDFLNKKLPLFIYTTSLPKDKNKAAAIRVRRILVCKIIWN